MLRQRIQRLRNRQGRQKWRVRHQFGMRKATPRNFPFLKRARRLRARSIRMSWPCSRIPAKRRSRRAEPIPSSSSVFAKASVCRPSWFGPIRPFWRQRPGRKCRFSSDWERRRADRRAGPDGGWACLDQAFGRKMPQRGNPRRVVLRGPRDQGGVRADPAGSRFCRRPALAAYQFNKHKSSLARQLARTITTGLRGLFSSSADKVHEESGRSRARARARDRRGRQCDARLVQ